MTVSAAKPFVLHVDDEPDDLGSWETEVRRQARVDIQVRHPNEVVEADLQRASLVLVDFKIDRWQERTNDVHALALKPVNGLALLSVLQEAAYELDGDSPRAFALFTAMVQDVARGLIPQPHIIARSHNLEWVFDKTGNDIAARAGRVADLAETVLSLPRPWPGDSSEHASAALKKWLAIPSGASWHDAAWQAVLGCRPPMHEFAKHTHGIGVLRWALHRVWPYPTFLLDDAHVAARLRVDLASFCAQIESSPALRAILEPARYCGPLENFVGRKWWRAGIESIIFDLASKDPASTAVLHEQLVKAAPALKTLGSNLAFAVMDANYNVGGSLATADEVVEVVPDDWPPFADTAWALRSDLEDHPDLAAIAVRIEDGE